MIPNINEKVQQLKSSFTVEGVPLVKSNRFTQEELDQLVAEIEALAESGELFENSREITEEDWDELDDNTKMQILKSLEDFNDDDKRTLH